MSDLGSKPKRFIWQRLDEIHATILDLKRGLEIMAAQTMVRQSELETLKYQVAAMAEGMGEIERRVEKLEVHNSSVNWIVRQLGTVALVIGAAYIASRFF